MKYVIPSPGLQNELLNFPNCQSGGGHCVVLSIWTWLLSVRGWRGKCTECHAHTYTGAWPSSALDGATNYYGHLAKLSLDGATNFLPETKSDHYTTGFWYLVFIDTMLLSQACTGILYTDTHLIFESRHLI